MIKMMMTHYSDLRHYRGAEVTVSGAPSTSNTTITIGCMNVDGIKFNTYKQRRLRRTNVDHDPRHTIPRVHVLGLQEVSGGPQHELTPDDCQRIADNLFPGARVWVCKHVLIALDAVLDDCPVHNAWVSDDEREIIVDATLQGHRMYLLNVYMDGGDATYRLQQLARISSVLTSNAPWVLFGDWNMVIDPVTDAVGSTSNEGGGTLQAVMHKHGLIDLLSEGPHGTPRNERRLSDLTWAPRGNRGAVIHKRLDFFLVNLRARHLTMSKFWGRGADCIIYPELHSTLEWQRAQVSDLSHVLIHHTNDR